MVHNLSINIDLKPSLDELRAKYAGELASSHQAASMDSTNGGKTMAIINTANRPWSVIDSEDLIETFAENQVVEFYFSPSGRKFDRSNHELDSAVSVVASERQLLTTLVNLRVSVIYLRVSPHVRSEYLISLVRLQFPEAKLFVEFYDMSLLFDEKTLSYMFDSDVDMLSENQTGCLTALHYADGIIVKMGGDAFWRWMKQFPVDVITYHPSVGIHQRTLTAPPERQSGTKRVIYAGSASAREITGGLGSVDGANIIAYCDAFIGQASMQLDIFNAAHTLKQEDLSPKFRALVERYDARSNIHYNRAIPRRSIVENAGAYDMGICCTHYANDNVLDVTKYGLPNRMLTYLEAGLPVIIDDRFAYGAELIIKFGAGEVIEAGNINQFTNTIRSLDLNKAHLGVSSLVTYMIKQNRKQLKNLILLAHKPSQN